MDSKRFDFALAIGGAAGQGIATPGNVLARLFTRRGSWGKSRHQFRATGCLLLANSGLKPHHKFINE